MPVIRSYLNILQDGRTRIGANTPVNNFNPQGIAKSFLDILALEAERIYNNLEYIYNAVDPTKAVGSDLDKIGYLVGQNRDSSTTPSDYSETNFYFYVDQRLNMSLAYLVKRSYSQEERDVLVTNGYLINDPATGDPKYIVIPAGTIVQNYDNTISYTTIDAVNIDGINYAYTGIVATGSGPSSNVETNVLVSSNINQIPELRKLAAYIKCSNRFPIQNGTNTLSDEDFRYRIATARVALQTNDLAIQRAALSIPGVRDILFEKSKFGNGTIGLIVDGISPLISQGLLDAVKEKTQQQLSYGDIIYVEAPTYLGVELEFGLITDPTGPDQTTLRSQATNAIIQYINDLPIGGEIVWNEIITIIMNIQGIQDIIPNVFKYGQYDPINKINKNQIILRFINQKADYGEKWYTDLGLISCCVV